MRPTGVEAVPRRTSELRCGALCGSVAEDPVDAADRGRGRVAADACGSGCQGVDQVLAIFKLLY